MAATNEAPVYGDVSSLPSGLSVVTSLPDMLIITDLIFGGLVWILIASARVVDPISQGWIMFVSVTLFMFSALLMIMLCTRGHSSLTLDACYHTVAAMFYLSSSILQTYITIIFSLLVPIAVHEAYKENIAAVVFSYFATVSYVIHAIFSLKRWKNSS
ncbi:myelin and lymphocyte protein-like [Rhinophrynus dorsalis]